MPNPEDPNFFEDKIPSKNQNDSKDQTAQCKASSGTVAAGNSKVAGTAKERNRSACIKYRYNNIVRTLPCYCYQHSCISCAISKL